MTADQVFTMFSVRAHLKWLLELGQVVRQGVQIRYTPHLKLSLTADQVLADLCLQ